MIYAPARDAARDNNIAGVLSLFTTRRITPGWLCDGDVMFTASIMFIRFVTTRHECHHGHIMARSQRSRDHANTSPYSEKSVIRSHSHCHVTSYAPAPLMRARLCHYC